MTKADDKKSPPARKDTYSDEHFYDDLDENQIGSGQAKTSENYGTPADVVYSSVFGNPANGDITDSSQVAYAEVHKKKPTPAKYENADGGTGQRFGDEEYSGGVTLVENAVYGQPQTGAEGTYNDVTLIDNALYGDTPAVESE